MVLKQRRVVSPVNHPDQQACVRRGNGIKAVQGGVTHKTSRPASLCQEGISSYVTHFESTAWFSLAK